MACGVLVRTDIEPVSQHQLAQEQARSKAPAQAQAQGPRGYGPADLQSAYNLAALSASGGTGQTVALVEAFDDPNLESNLATYRSEFGLPPCTTANGCFAKLNEDGQSGPLAPPAGLTGWAVEQALDVDMVSAICPNCHILVVEANNSAVGLDTTVNTAVAAGARYVSASWGNEESHFGGDPSGARFFFDHPGVAITVSGGDEPGTRWPAVVPYVTAVGGTTLRREPSSPRGWSETVWGDTGSGCSRFEFKPEWEIHPGCGNRAQNDVAAVADPNTGVAIYDTYLLGGWAVVGGTSASSPIIAAVYALAGQPTAGTYPASYPYARQSSLYDVVSGVSGTCTPGTRGYLCEAGPGYDGPSGLGTPDGVLAFTDKTATATALGSSLRPSQLGQSVTFTATVTSLEGGAVPTGTVVFRDGSMVLGGGPVTLDGSGQATLSTSSLEAGDRSIAVAYAGDADHAPSASTPLDQLVIGPPSANATTPANHATYTTGQAVEADYSCIEASGGPGISSCVGTVADGASIDTSTNGSHTFTVTVTSSDGQGATATSTYLVAGAPTASISAPSSGGTYAMGQSVQTSFSCQEGAGGRALSSCDDSTGTTAASGGHGHLDTSAAGAHTYTVTSVSQDSQTGTTEITYTVAASPSAAISSPAPGSKYKLGQAVRTDFSCSEGARGPGLSACNDSTGTVTTSGGYGRLNTSVAGTHTYTVTSVSRDGQTGTTEITYTVAPGPLTVEIRNARAFVRDGRATVELTCRGGAPGSACRGTLWLGLSKQIVLARVRYTIANGQDRLVKPRLTAAGLRLLDHTKIGRLWVQATATVGGSSAHRTMLLRLEPQHARPVAVPFAGSLW
jgi:hypothetical protein